MGTIIYEILGGELPITVNISNEITGYTNIHNNYGVFEFNNILTGFSYDFTIIDSFNCTLTKIINPCQCANGYSPIMGICQKIETLPATPPNNPKILYNTPYFNYSSLGTFLFSDYNLDGTGTISQHINTNFWCNINKNTIDGPLNRTGVWTNSTLDLVVGFTISLNLIYNKVYYIGVGCDNYIQIRLNGTIIMQQNGVNMRNDILRQGYVTYKSDQTPFINWFIYPISMSSGFNTIEIIGYNIGGPATVGCEIYNASPTDIASATSYSDLGNKLLFSSKDIFNQYAQLGNNIGYTCPTGYSLVYENNTYYCRKITYKNCGEV